jgi:hypothetical protein
MNYEWAGTWKVVVVVYSRYYIEICLEGLRRTTKILFSTAGFWVNINISPQKVYNFTVTLSCLVKLYITGPTQDKGTGIAQSV